MSVSAPSVKELRENVAILVASCDKYSDLWDPFFKVFWRFWPDCPFELYLLSNELRPQYEQVKNIAGGHDRSWSDNLAKALSEVRCEYVFLHLDDLFFFKLINTEKVLKLFMWALVSKANYLRMNPTPGPDTRLTEEVGGIATGALYRTSTVLSLWKRTTLMDLLKPFESAWEFEIYGTRRSDCYERFYASTETTMPVLNGVIKGKWQRVAVRRLRDMGCPPDLARRPTMSRMDAVLYKVKQLRSWGLRCCPAGYRRRIRELVLRTHRDYQASTEQSE